MKKKIILHGELAKRFGREHEFDVASPSEAIRALKANFKGFGQMLMTAHVYGIGFKVIVGKRALNDESEALHPSSDRDVIRIIPAIFGSGGGVFKTLLGVALAVGGVIVSGASFGAAEALGQGMISTGVGLVIGGVAQLLTRPPAVDQLQEAERKQSYVFNGPANTSSQGGPVPVGYGRMVVGSITVSAGIETDEA